MIETWYVLEDGQFADPAEVGHGDDGRLVHASGAFVAMKGNVPHSRGVDADEERAKVAKLAPQPPVEHGRDMAPADPKPLGQDRQMRPGPAKKYQTR